MTNVFGFFFVVVALLAAQTITAQPEHLFQQYTLKRGDSAEIAYYTQNPKPDQTPLIIISGGPGTDHRYMNAAGAFEQLADLRPVVMYDQRATGSSSPAPATPTIDLWVDDLEALRIELGTDQVDLLGHSFGGYLAMSYAVAYPDRVRSIILVDTAPADITSRISLLSDVYPDRIGAWSELRGSLDDQFPAESIGLFFSMEFVDPEWGERYTSYVKGLTYDISVNNALRQDMLQRDLDSQLGLIKSPILILHGRFDAILAVSNSYQLHQRFASSKFHVLERSGHAPFIEEPALFIERVEQFLSALNNQEQRSGQ